MIQMIHSHLTFRLDLYKARSGFAKDIQKINVQSHNSLSADNNCYVTYYIYSAVLHKCLNKSEIIETYFNFPVAIDFN